jgi:hypothetical protein
MTLDKTSFDYIKEMISNNENINSLKSFCKGFGMDVDSYSSPVHIANNKIAITYRRISHYVTYNHSKIYGTNYFNKIN